MNKPKYTAMVDEDASASVTAANVCDSHKLPSLLHGEETRFCVDSTS
jgi:hypothetical protein